MNKTIKEYLKSSAITFLAGVGFTLIANWDTITLDSFSDGTVVGIVFVAVRAGFKGAIELALKWYADYIV